MDRAAVEEMATADETTVSVPEAGRMLGCSKNTAYELVRQHRFPVPVIRVGAKLRVPLLPLRRLLGAEDA